MEANERKRRVALQCCVVSRADFGFANYWILEVE